MRLIYPLLLLLVSACGHRSTSNSNAQASASGNTDSTITPSENYYKRYTGAIADQPVVVHLNVYKGRIQGTCYYSNTGKSMLLRKWNSELEDGGTLYLKERPIESSGDADSTSAIWSLTLNGNKAEGTLRHPFSETRSTIDLTEDYSNGATLLNANWLADSVALIPANPSSPRAVSRYGYVLPRTAVEDFLYHTLKHQLVPGAAQGDDIPHAIQSAMASYFASYRRENEPLVKSTEADLQAFAFAYESDVAVYVRFNEDNWVVTEQFSTESTGGMHSNYSSSFTNIDVAGKRVWTLPDIVSDTIALRPLLSDAAISFLRLKPGQSVGGRLLVDEVPVTANVFIGAKGLSFVYNPYEIASYAEGQITLFLPYTKLLQILTPAFRQRMKLSEQSGVALLSFFN
jgi:hypothetical protein